MPRKKVLSEVKISYRYSIISTLYRIERKKTNIVSISYRMKKNVSLKGAPVMLPCGLSIVHAVKLKVSTA